MLKRFLVLSLIVLIGYILQSTLFQYLDVFQVAPNILLIITVSFALIRGKLEGAFIGFFCGLLMDIFFGRIIGFNALMYMYIGYFNGFVYKLFFKESLLIPTLMVLVSTFAYGFSYYVFAFLLRGRTEIWYYLYRIVIPEMVYTTFITLFLYRIILYINNKLELKEKGV
ncbi:rod shape-determining protein MreD [Natranaerovirga hydrolytica]|uniref:Rod shape-determining protein MreD n=1 Tax=Natranaerovirga hydrolytica TaxID=680378 RepID=A0A4R1MXT5_9FIRM|nr:rod shape-determining protein MreD [Natranaerovirga hydrolytica]TCK98088.1 rod shape-determining protein MreD [Natranaerovirga hydrolytica]